MILPNRPQTTDAVAAHYDELDPFYRDIWGEHVHHGYWATGRETPAEAAEALVSLVADRLALVPGMRACDIGCGYGLTAQRLAERHRIDVTGVTVSAAQAARGQARLVSAGRLRVLQQDFLSGGFAPESFDRAYAIESSEHMPDKQLFFDEAWRTLRPGGLLAVCAWLARRDPRPWEVRHLLEPICREGRLPGMGDETEYRALAERSGFAVLSVADISAGVRRTWSVCARRLALRLASRPHYRRFLRDSRAANRRFALTVLRIIVAYRTGSMRYCLLVFRKEAT